MRGAVLAAMAATIGNFLEGWDNGTIAGAVIYIKREFNLQSQPTIEGLIVAISLIAASVITTFSGPVSDILGRRSMLVISSVLYLFGGLVTLWSPNVYILLLARLLNGFAIGLALTLVPVYISEIAPPDIRGQLNTIPQLSGSTGMFLSYCVVFGMSLTDAPSWRLMLGFISFLSIFYIALTAFFLPESPRWLVSKGRMAEAKKVLQTMSGREDVSAEMTLLVEGLGVGGETSLEEYIIGPDNELADNDMDKDQIKLYGAEEGQSWIAKPVTEQSAPGVASRLGSGANQSVPYMDPLVTLFGSVHEKLPEMGSMRNIPFSIFGSMFNAAEHEKQENWDAEGFQEGGKHHYSEASGCESDDNLHSPLLSRQGTSAEKDIFPPLVNGSHENLKKHGSLIEGNAGEAVSGMGIGGGWQLAYMRSEKPGEDGKKGGGLKRIYLHQDGTPVSQQGSLVSLVGGDARSHGEFIHASALVSQSVVCLEDCNGRRPLGNIQPFEIAAKGPSLRELFEPGVKHALVVGVALQFLQQFAGINGVLYYTPQILEQAGVGVLLSNLGLSSDSATILISAVITLLMLPSIGIAMRLMDVAGRRWLLLSTLPALLASLLVLVLGNVIEMGSLIHAIMSTIGVVVYFCCFVMGFGPIPSIICSEIFPTRVRGLCIAICALTYWIGDMVVTYTLPVMLKSIGIAGVFGSFAVVCAISWIFVFLKVPETKGMPLEVITEFFALGTKKSVDNSAVVASRC